MASLNPLDWLVIGAGPAGIAVVGKLLDQGIDPQSIGWVDPAFKVGDLGTKWLNVPSNTKVALFHKFLLDCKAFGYKQSDNHFALDQLEPEENCFLKEIAAPLQAVTDRLKEQVVALAGLVLALNCEEGIWQVKTEEKTLYAKRVVLANGSEPRELQHPAQSIIPLEVALNPEKLSQKISKDDRVAVFGSSHSAILILANLLKTDVQKVYNFYRSPHLYAVYFKDWILYDDSGLKGFAAKWARANLDAKHPEKLERVLTGDPVFEERLALCNKVVYAVGFEKKKVPVIETYPNASYSDTTGIIAPGLFGFGIGYPQMKLDRLGNKTYRVGLWKFMDYLNSVLPIWMDY